MQLGRSCGLAAMVILSCPALCVAQATFLSQSRTIEVSTSSNAQQLLSSAPGFGPFVESVNLSTTFPGLNGTPVANDAHAGIDCQVDPDAVRATGSLQGSGGLSITGSTEFGEARANLSFVFRVDHPVAFRLMATPRPAGLPTDQFLIKLRTITTNRSIYELEGGIPAAVNEAGTLEPETYRLEYSVELTSLGDSNSGEFGFTFLLGGRCWGACRVDVDDGSNTGTPDGGVTIDDLLYYLQLYSTGLDCADVDDGSGLGTPDGGVTVDDLVYFLARFAAGC